MTKHGAWKEANARWRATNCIAFVRLRRKCAPLRYEVGHHNARGADVTVLGRGDSWEAAFAMADRDATPRVDPALTAQQRVGEEK